MNWAEIALIITGAVCVLVIVLIVIYYRVSNDEETTFVLSAVAFVIAVGCFVGFGIAAKNLGEEELYTYQSRDIKSLVLQQETTESASGYFVIGIGSYHQETEITTLYYMWVKGEEGYFLCQIEVSTDTEVIETNEKTPCVYARFKGNQIHRTGKVRIYVPVSTIKVDYKLTLEGK